MIRAGLNRGPKMRVRRENLTRTGQCGRSGTHLPRIGAPINGHPPLLDDIVRSATVPVLVDFWAAWCGPCRMAATEVEKVASTMAGRALVIKVDTDAHPELGARFDVRGIPNYVVLKNGRTVHQQPGVVAASEMMRWLEQAAR